MTTCLMARFGAADFCACGRSARARRPASAATCGGNYEGFLAQMQRDAQAAGVAPQIIGTAFAGLAPDQSVLAFDRRQHGMFHSKSSRNMRAPASSRRASAARGG